MIVEQIYLGNLNSGNRYADIEVDIYFNNENKGYKNVRAFIDTGAASTRVNQKLIQSDIDLNSVTYKEKDSQGANGAFKSFIIPNISIRLNPFQKSVIPLREIQTINSPDMPYDVIIGNDILLMCEFIYNGLSETYVLKIFSQA